MERTYYLLRDCLLDIHDNGPKDETMGICHNIDLAGYMFGYSTTELEMVNNVFKDLAEQWPKYSGYESYPVPSTNPDIGPGRCFYETRNLWIGPYGDLRRELLEFCIDWLDANLSTTHCVAPIYSD